MTIKPSYRFQQSRDLKVLVDDERIVGYAVYSGGKGGGATVRPIYEATAYIKRKRRNGKPETVIVTTHETGDTFHGTFFEDYEGASLAMIAWTAINALVQRKALREAQTKNARRKNPKAKPRTRR